MRGTNEIMKKITIFLSMLIVFGGCDSFKQSNSLQTTKELCQISRDPELIKQRIQYLYESGLDKEIIDGLEKKDVSFLKCLLDYNYDGIRLMIENKPSDISGSYSSFTPLENKHIDTILHRVIASGWGKAEILPLLDSITAIDTPDSKGNSPLMLACLNGDIELAELLLQKGGNINFLSQNMDTPLSFAVASGRLDLVKFLIEAGSGKNLGNSPLSIALRLEDKKKADAIADYLLKVGVKYKEEYLVTAAKHGMPQVVNRLLSLGVSPISTWDTYTPLMAASAYGHVEVVRQLLKTKAGKKYYKERICNSSYKYFSAGLDQPKIVGYDHFFLWEENPTNHHQLMAATALLYATKSDSVEIVKLLLEAGADPNYNTSIICREDRERYHKNQSQTILNARSGCFVTPLILASERGNQEMIKLLVKHGAKIDFQCKENPSSWNRLMNKEKTIVRTAFSVAKNQETRNLLARLAVIQENQNKL